MSDTEKVTLIKEAIHDPNDARHFMRVKPIDKTVTATIQGKEIAKSNKVLKVQEVGFDLYDPVFYFPKDDVQMDALHRTEKSTHCPLKGDTEYFDVNFTGTPMENVAWHYSQPLDRSKMLKEHIAFDQSQVQIIEHIDA
ncbi:DUF427 domain-containing protein [Catalinimonas sp. 4WD22]|uniref:DUF427 domain-containing protein n=1 Tax=Catalinimonas locisalis TaxID=3133978 RepID=UPI0031011011